MASARWTATTTTARFARMAPGPSPAAATISRVPDGGTATAAVPTSMGRGRSTRGPPRACAGPPATSSPPCVPACCSCAPLLPAGPRPPPTCGRASLNVQARLCAVSSLGSGQGRGRAQLRPSLAAQTLRCPPGTPVHPGQAWGDPGGRASQRLGQKQGHQVREGTTPWC